jgi:hypothetical protein
MQHTSALFSQEINTTTWKEARRYRKNSESTFGCFPTQKIVATLLERSKFFDEVQ